MRRIKIVFILCAVFLFSVVPVGATAPQDYTWTYSQVNVYSNETLSYSFSGLDSTTTYTWSIQLLSNAGVVYRTLDSVQFSGVTTATWDITGWPTDTYGPMRVVDNFGTTLAYHFIAPQPASTWSSDSGATPAVSKTSIGFGYLYDLQIGPPEDGRHHPAFRAGASTVKYGNYTLLNYRTEDSISAAYEWIEISDISTATAVCSMRLSELIDYNIPSGESLNYVGYVVLTTNGAKPKWINAPQDAAASWTSCNPHSATLPLGAYDYARLGDDSGPSRDLLLAAGESSLLVTTSLDTTQDTASGLTYPREWRMWLQTGDVKKDGQGKVFIAQKTSEILTAYDDQILATNGEVIQVPITGEISDYKGYSFTAKGTPGADTVFWIVTNGASTYGSDYPYYMSTSYTVNSETTIDQAIPSYLDRLGANTDWGQTLFYAAVVTGVLLLFSVFHLPSTAGVMAFIVISAVWAGMHWLPPFMLVVVFVACLAALWWLVKRRDAPENV